MLAYPANLWLINRPHGANGYRTKMSTRNHSVPVSESQHHVIDPTNASGALNNRIENRLHIRRRAADDPEHLCGRRLMFQRLAQFCIAVSQLFEQSHVLDGDYGLGGE